MPIGLLFADSLGAYLGCVSDPQLQLQLSQQSFEPARVPTGFHSHTHLLALRREIAVELLRLRGMRQTFFLKLSAVGIHQSNLLKLG